MGLNIGFTKYPLYRGLMEVTLVKVESPHVVPLEQESLHQVNLTFPRNSVTHQVLLFIQLSQGNAPAVQKRNRRSRERARTGKERFYLLHKSHTTQVAASKAHQGCLMSPGTPAL
ncbi:hypothetical protein TNCV_4197411 [Trichonephila clavipes]|nr:hypothetical protein TNCV_4197411 [Trichonephila clavipes]